MFMLNKPLSLGAILLVAGSAAALSGDAFASPDNSVWYQPPRPAVQPVPQHQPRSTHVRVSSRSHYNSARHYDYGRHYGSSYSRFGRSYSSCSPVSYSYGYGSPSYRFSSPYRSYSRPTVISYPSSSTRITYVTPVVSETRYTRSQAAGAYDAVSYREYQRLLAEQRVLRQQIIDQQQQREREAASRPTYNPGPAVPSNAPLSIAKQSPDSLTKPDRPRSADEIFPPVPRETSVQTQAESEAATDALAPQWQALAEGNYAYAMRLFSELAGEQNASTADRVGFAIAAAGMGQRERAAWALRRALVADASGFGFIPASDELRSTLDRLASDIARDAQARPEGPERRMSMFLAAGIEYLALDMDSGLELLDQARVDGEDHHEGAIRLRELFRESGATGF
jgi:hypothetical protein